MTNDEKIDNAYSSMTGKFTSEQALAKVRELINSLNAISNQDTAFKTAADKIKAVK